MRGDRIFLPIAGDSPAFNSTAFGSTRVSYALESTDTSRLWQGPGNRSVKLSNANADASFFVQFGSQFVAASTNSILIPGAHPHVFYIPSNITHISFVSSTSVTVNIALGYGGETDYYIPRSAATISSTVAIFTTPQAGSITYVYWLDTPAPWSKGDAEHILGVYHDTTST